LTRIFDRDEAGTSYAMRRTHARINTNCTLNWATVRMHMEAKDWAAAKAAVTKKT
jgi:hypothetical protein